MELTEQQKEQLAPKLDELITRISPCIVCESTSWSVSTAIMELPEYGGDEGEERELVPTAVTPVLPVMCNECGHTHLFNAIKLEIVERKSEAEAVEESGRRGEAEAGPEEAADAQ